MGWKHSAPAWKIRLRPHLHHVLLALAHQACEDCGITWLGVRGISERTGWGVTAVRAALAELVKQDLIRVHAYPKGGRGKSTEYLVLPEVVELSTSGLCINCHNRQNTPRGGGYDNENTPRGGGYSGNPPPEGVKTHRTGGDHSSDTTHSSRASRDAVASPPISNHPPATDRITDDQASENARRAAEIVTSLSAQFQPPAPKPREGQHD